MGGPNDRYEERAERRAALEVDHPAILKPTAPLEDKVEGRKLLYRQYTCDPQGLAALCCELDAKGYEPVQVLPGYFGSGVNGPFHTPLGWTVLARLKVAHYTDLTPLTKEEADQLRQQLLMNTPFTGTPSSSSASRGKRK